MPPTPTEASPPHPTRERTPPRNPSQFQGYQPTSAGACSQAGARFGIGMQKTGRAKNKSPEEKSRRRKKGYEADGRPGAESPPLGPASRGAARQRERGVALCYRLREAPATAAATAAIASSPGRRFPAVLAFLGRVVDLPLLGLEAFGLALVFPVLLVRLPGG